MLPVASVDPDRALLLVVPRWTVETAGAPAPELHPDVSDRFGNVVSLAHARAEREHGKAPAVPPPAAAERPDPPRAPQRPRRFLALVTGSALLHATAVAIFMRDPPPQASIGIRAMSVELVLGADTLAGLAKSPGQSETNSAASAGEPKPNPAPKQEQPADNKAEPPPAANPAAAGDPDPVDTEPPTRELATPPASAVSGPPPDSSAPPVPTDAPPAAAVVRDETAEQVASVPPPAPEAKAVPPAPLRPKPDSPKPLAKPEVSKPATRPTPKQQAKPAARNMRVANHTADNGNGHDQRTRSTPSSASIAATAASGIGRGRSDLDTNYRGLVAAHLARYKQFPAEARASGSQGASSVSFSIDGSGRVTSVRLGRSSGVASLDQETTAMVRRASPFPPPPGGHPMSFSVPVSFYLR